MGYSAEGAEYYKKSIADKRRAAKKNPNGMFAKLISVGEIYLSQSNITDRAKALKLGNEFFHLAMTAMSAEALHGKTIEVARIDSHICSLGFAARMDEVEQAMAQQG